MKKNLPLIFEIKGSSFDDGPGIRTAIFFKGCPLSCVWCHNPESQKPDVELFFDKEKCVHCGSCINNCRQGAVRKNNTHFVDREICTLCLECTENCPSGALEPVGKTMHLESLIDEIVKDKPFFDSSGGGVTLSGGEPLMAMGFVSDLLARLKTEGIHTLIETCGVFKFSQFEDLILPFTDTVYMDIKLIDPLEHKQYCGLSNEVVLKNFILLKDAADTGKIEFLPRVPLIPGITDSPDNLMGIGDFLKKTQWEKIQLLPYNPLWIDKHIKIGNKLHPEPEERMKTFMSENEIEQCKDFFLSRNIEVV